MSENAHKVHLRKFHQMSVMEDVLQEPRTLILVQCYLVFQLILFL